MVSKMKHADHPAGVRARRAALGTPDEDAEYSVEDLVRAEKALAFARSNPPTGEALTTLLRSEEPEAS